MTASNARTFSWGRGTVPMVVNPHDRVAYSDARSFTLHESFFSFHVHDVSEFHTLKSISEPYYDKYYVVHAIKHNDVAKGIIYDS